MKKILYSISVLGVLAFAFTVASPASANGWHWGSGIVVMNHNEAMVTNFVGAVSNTGMNSIGETDDNFSFTTGNAIAGALLGNMVNTNETAVTEEQMEDPDDLEGCGCQGGIKVLNSNSAMVMNGVFALANTGHNSVGSSDDDASFGTGDATAGVEVTNVVNSNMTTVMRPGFDDTEDEE